MIWVGFKYGKSVKKCYSTMSVCLLVEVWRQAFLTFGPTRKGVTRVRWITCSLHHLGKTLGRQSIWSAAKWKPEHKRGAEDEIPFSHGNWRDSPCIQTVV
jgi:hypothetical protein